MSKAKWQLLQDAAVTCTLSAIDKMAEELGESLADVSLQVFEHLMLSIQAHVCAGEGEGNGYMVGQEMLDLAEDHFQVEGQLT